nr:hypothetical protein [Schwartzia sp. (in: firmicutes)]
MEIMRPEIQVEECSSTAARLVIGPLERGYGQTIGNALRRVLFRRSRERQSARSAWKALSTNLRRSLA